MDAECLGGKPIPKFLTVDRVFGRPKDFPGLPQRLLPEPLIIGGLPRQNVFCPRCRRLLSHVATLPLCLTEAFGAREPLPIYACPFEEVDMMLAYTVRDGEVEIVDSVIGTRAVFEPDSHYPLWTCHPEEELDLAEITLPSLEPFHALRDEQFLLTYDGDDFTGFCENESRLIEEWIKVLRPEETYREWAEGMMPPIFGGVPPSGLRLYPPTCPLTGALMTIVGSIPNQLGASMSWTSLYENTMVIAFCPESSCVAVMYNVLPDYPMALS